VQLESADREPGERIDAAGLVARIAVLPADVIDPDHHVRSIQIGPRPGDRMGGRRGTGHQPLPGQQILGADPHPTPPAAHHVVDRDRQGRLVGASELDVIDQVLADGPVGGDHRNRQRLETTGIADAGEFQQLR